ncbi:MAG TPA: VWA domain-containing protein [Terracidiphilus sp.]|nr:VWA domain-containing protein [Terracidiphilus sp.]
MLGEQTGTANRWHIVARGIFLGALLTASALSCLAAKKVSVAELESTLPELCGHRTDENCANQIADFELTERLSSAKLAHLYASLPGEKSRQSLLALADQSALLGPPAASIPTKAAPEVAEQRRMMGLVVAYLSKTIPNLPNFFATRQITYFEDQPFIFGTTPYQPLHPTGNTTTTVLYRNGLEVVDTGKEVKEASKAGTSGLNAWGIFGPVLGIVLVDAAQNTLAWSHWETTSAGTEAVFHYSVPQDKSHYRVDYCCVAVQTEAEASMMPMHRNDTLRPTYSSGTTLQPFRQYVGYHGEMAVDPDTGTILRLTLIADLKPTDPIDRASIMVEYGKVDIAGRTYICPVRSVSISHAQEMRYSKSTGTALADVNVPMQTRLNDVQFADYHVFRADSRIVKADTKGDAAADTAAQAGTENSAENALEDKGATTAAAQPASAAPAEATASTPAASTPATSATTTTANGNATPAAVAAKPEPEYAVEGNATVPTNSNSTDADTNNLTLHAESRLVDVSVIVTDKKGKPVRGLAQDNFVVEDNGVSQAIKFFSAPGEAAPNTAPVQAPQTDEKTIEPVFSNRETAARKVLVSGHSIILLIDSSNIAFGDLSYARQQMQKFLQSVDGAVPVGLYILGSQGYRILAEPTQDHSAISVKLAHWMPTAQDLAQAQAKEALNRQQIDEVHKQSDLTRVNGHTDFSDSSGGTEALDPQLRDYGRNPGRDALAFLLPVADHLSSLAGHKSLVWIASDNVLADWAGRSTDVGNNNASLSAATLRTQEALNNAHVSIYPLDVSQLEAGGVDASLQHRNVELTQAAKDNVGLMGSGGGSFSSSSGEDVSTGRNMQPGRVTAQMQQDIHAIAPLYQEMAKATGGRSLRRAGDIAGELNGISADGDALYQLSFSPQAPADDKYHRIDVKVNARSKLQLRYRTGYFYTKQPVTLHDRFQKAIWQAADMKEIGLSAEAAHTSEGAALKLRIAVSDLGLTEQGGRWMGKIDLFVIQRNNASGRARISGQTIGLRLLPSTYQDAQKDGLPLETAIPAKLGEGDLRILLIDRSSQRIGTLTIPAWQLEAGPSAAQNVKP